MNKPLQPLSKQSGEVKFWHVILIVIFVVGFALFLNARGAGFFTETIPNSLGFSDYKKYTEARMTNANYTPEPGDTDQDILVIEPDSPQQQAPQSQTNRYPQSTTEYNDNLYESNVPTPNYNSYDQQFPPHLNRGYYTVQVFNGYNSKYAYDLRTALKGDGYTATHIRELRLKKGVLFKVRIGRYRDRYAAFAVRDQIRRRYPSTLGNSFVILVEYQYN